MTRYFSEKFVIDNFVCQTHINKYIKIIKAKSIKRIMLNKNNINK